MDCTEAQKQLLDRRRGTLDPAHDADVAAHLEECGACRAEDAADRQLGALLEALPGPRAPEALRRSLSSKWDPGRRRARPFAATSLTAGIGAVALAVMVLLVVIPRSIRGVPGSGQRDRDPMVAEAVNDHLRVLYSEHPVEVESGGIHQVKPWFSGRLDFAPVVAFGGDDDFPLQGGAVGYFLDRKAATFVFKRRLHVITLFVFRGEGLPWPALATQPRGTLETSRGFHVLLWRGGDLGYALVSDVDPADLQTLAAKVAGGP